MRRYIAVTDAQRAAIIKVFGVTGRTVHNALSYDPKYGFSDKAKRIREMARKQGAVTYYVATGDEVFFDSEGNMRQVLDNGVEIFVDKSNGKGMVSRRGVEIVTMENMKISELAALQAVARTL